MEGSKLGDKSRRERRKEARLGKNKKKFDSWVQHHQLQKLKKTKNNLKTEKVQKSTQITEERKSSITNSKQLLETTAPNNLKDSIDVKRKKVLQGKSKTKFEEYLDIDSHSADISAEEDLRIERKLAKKLKVKDKKLHGEDDDINMLFEGIPPPLKSLEAEEGEASRKTSALRKIVANDKYINTLKCSVSSSEPKVLRKKKTKFEKYLEMDKQHDASAKEDLALERKLAKKLKVKKGKLRGDEDEINMLYEGISSVFDSLETEEKQNAEEASGAHLKNNTPRKKHRKNSEQKLDTDMDNEDVVELAEPETSTDVELDSESNPTQVPITGGNAKYVPPQLRSMSRNEAEEYSQIRKRVRGLLNRLSDSNIEGIARDMSTIFQSIGRSVGSQIISKEILASCSRGPRGNEQHAAVFAAFVSGLACLVGIDFGAKLLSALATSFEEEYLKEDNISLRNLTLLLSYLYIFGVCSSDLIYDFMMMLSTRLTKVEVSTISMILNCCGMRLRSDDPTALKSFFDDVQNKVKDLKTAAGNNQENMTSKRGLSVETCQMNSMLETISEIKNNKKRAKEDPSWHSRIKKWLQKLRVESILVRGLKWSKLLDPEKKGQWWLSGEMATTTDNVENVAKKIDREISEAQKMLQLAAGQRMNTDARRAIFCIIMSGEDYIDAFEKLLRLDLPGKQDREIMRVLVECCLQEKVFNKYYCVLASKLCSHDKNHKFTLQYCIWDQYAEVESMDLIRSMHLAKFIAEMVASFTLSLAVLKKVDLHDTTQLTSRKIMHFRIFFEAIFEYPDDIVWNIFKRIAGSPQYESLRTGTKFFVERYLMATENSFAGKYKIAKKALKSVEEDVF